MPSKNFQDLIKKNSHSFTFKILPFHWIFCVLEVFSGPKVLKVANPAPLLDPWALWYMESWNYMAHGPCIHEYFWWPEYEHRLGRQVSVPSWFSQTPPLNFLSGLCFTIGGKADWKINKVSPDVYWIMVWRQVIAICHDIQLILYGVTGLRLSFVMREGTQMLGCFHCLKYVMFPVVSVWEQEGSCTCIDSRVEGHRITA